MLPLLLTLLIGASDADIRKQAAALRDGDTDAWRRVPWAKTLPEAIAAARREGRPLFLFSHEGNIDTGRC